MHDAQNATGQGPARPEPSAYRGGSATFDARIAEAVRVSGAGHAAAVAAVENETARHHRVFWQRARHDRAFYRPAAFLLSATMAADYLKAHAPVSLFPAVNQGDYVLLWSIIFFYLVFAGPGPWSLDVARGRS